MINLFYVIGIAFIMYEFSRCQESLKWYNFYEKLKKTGHKEYNSYQKFANFFMFIYATWTLIGLFTFQWYLFLGIITISLVPKKNLTMHIIDSYVSLILLILIILNKYHFKYTLF